MAQATDWSVLFESDHAPRAADIATTLDAMEYPVRLVEARTWRDVVTEASCEACVATDSRGASGGGDRRGVADVAAGGAEDAPDRTESEAVTVARSAVGGDGRATRLAVLCHTRDLTMLQSVLPELLSEQEDFDRPGAGRTGWRRFGPAARHATLVALLLIVFVLAILGLLPV